MIGNDEANNKHIPCGPLTMTDSRCYIFTSQTPSTQFLEHSLQALYVRSQYLSKPVIGSSYRCGLSPKRDGLVNPSPGGGRGTTPAATSDA